MRLLQDIDYDCFYLGHHIAGSRVTLHNLKRGQLPWFSGLCTQTRIALLAFLGLQLADDRLWAFSAFIII
ncbi:hypothetical protein CapIbe_008957 [Capra ibex]